MLSSNLIIKLAKTLFSASLIVFITQPTYGLQHNHQNREYGVIAQSDVQWFNPPYIQRENTVKQIYREILQREVDPSGLQTWTNELKNGRTVPDVRRAIAESPETRAKLNELYQRMLCRDIDSSGKQTWTNALANGWSLKRVEIEGIKPSPEYQRVRGQCDRLNHSSTSPTQTTSNTSQPSVAPPYNPFSAESNQDILCNPTFFPYGHPECKQK